MDNHPLSSSRFLDGSTYPSDLVLNIMEDSSSSANDNLSTSSSSIQSYDAPKTQLSYPYCIFQCKPNSHPFQERCIPLNEQVKIGRAVARLKALPNNAIFDCKVLSRQHAKIWYENGKLLLQDTKSSNGTFVNNERIGKCNEESAPFEIFSGDIIQFGVDVTENNRKTVHNCIIMEVRLFNSDGREGLSRCANGSAQSRESDLNTQALHELELYLQESMFREQALENKLEYLQGVLRDVQKISDDNWQAIIHEDRLLSRINALEDQVRMYQLKHPNEDMIKQELMQVTQSHLKFEEESKIKLEQVLHERTCALTHGKKLEYRLQSLQEELKRHEELKEQHQQETQQLVKSVDEQRSLISEYEIKLRDSEKQCADLENERQQTQATFDEYYQRTSLLEEKLAQNATNNDQQQVEACLKDITNRSVEIPIMRENGDSEKHDDPAMLSNENIPMVDQNHQGQYNVNNGYDSMEELMTAQNKIASLREDLNETMERLVSTEDSCRSEQERYRLLTTEYETARDELVQLKIRFNRENHDTNELLEEQKLQLEHLSKSILSKQKKHNHLLSVYICFFLCCYLLIFFLFFFLLSW